MENYGCSVGNVHQTSPGTLTTDTSILFWWYWAKIRAEYLFLLVVGWSWKLGVVYGIVLVLSIEISTDFLHRVYFIDETIFRKCISSYLYCSNFRKEVTTITMEWQRSNSRICRNSSRAGVLKHHQSCRLLMTFSVVHVRCTAAESVFSSLKNKDAGVAIYRYRLLILWKETYLYIS